MYFDDDGAATKNSQAQYNSRVRALVFTTSILSWLGLSAALIDGEYTRERLRFSLSLKQPSIHTWGKLLWPFLSFNSLGLHWKQNPIKIYNAGLRGSLLSLFIVLFKLLPNSPEGPVRFFTKSPACLQLYTGLILAIIQTLYPRRPDLFTSEEKPVDLEKSSSAFHRYSMQWCSSALRLAGNNVTLDELPILDHSTRSKSQPLIAMGFSATTLWDRILTERYLAFVKQWALMLMRAMITFGSPYCVMRLLKSLEGGRSDTDDAWIWLVGVGVSSTCQTIINHHLIWIQWSEMGIPIRAQLIMAIFQKALKMKDSKDLESSSFKKLTDRPEAINLISSDTLSFSKFTAVNYIIPSSFIKFFLAVVFLVKLLGWQSTLVGMMVTVVCVPVHTVIIKQQRAAQINLIKARDKKTKAITEALHALRQIKFSALETEWEEHIDSLRREELKHLRWSFTISNLRSVWATAAPLMVATASIYTYAHFKGSASPSIIFPMIEVLPHLQGTLGFVPVVFQDYFGARSNANRIDEFLKRPEQKNILRPSPSGNVSFRDVSMAWPSNEAGGDSHADKQPTFKWSHRFFLHDVTLDFPAGELSVICGKTGSGKSLLLAAIIGEADILSGSANAPSRASGHPVALVSQTPWLQNATLKDNILFGHSFDRDRYEKVLSACALQPDVAALPKGSETHIGLRGVKLSGGQRARVALGRALYSNAQLLVLDDIFSALDSHVSKEIFHALTGELGKGRTRILATHQVSLCLPKTKYIVNIRNNTVNYVGKPGGIRELEDVGEGEIGLGPDPPARPTAKQGASDKQPRSKVSAVKVKGSSSRTDLKVYKSYFAAAGGHGFSSMFLLGLVLKQLLNATTTWLLGRINSDRPKVMAKETKNDLLRITNEGNGPQHYFYLYLLCSLLAVTLESLFSIHTVLGSLRASKTLFREITFRSLRMPLLWLDTTPIGEMLKRFTVDSKLVDDLALVTMSEFADCLIKMVIVVSLGLHTSKYTCFLTVALLLWSAQIGRGYIAARSTVKRADAAPTADILEHFTSSVAGVSTIRAFGAVDNFVEDMHRHLDRLSTARRHFWIFNRWLGLQMSFVGILFSTSTGVILLSSKSAIDPSLVGFSLTFSMGLSQAIFKAVNNFGILETYMNSVGAIIGYTELKIEEQGGNEVPEDWPSRGKVEVNGLDVAYSADLPPVLRNVSFTAEAGKRLGIVGRTGAGKSSLTLSILRLLDPQKGSILIDDIDISTIKLQTLRSRISFIPQDPVLFSGTVRSNLDFFNQVSEGKLTGALRRVKLLSEESDNKPGLFTLDSQISEGGTNMSQGQRQLLCMARVMIKNPEIVILDEATSAVDNETDLWIQNTIRNEFNGTLIVVAHRLRTIASFDQVVVIDNGRVAESGKPADLLRKRGLFHSLVQNSEDQEFLTRTILN